MMRKAVRSAKENDFNPRIPLGMRQMGKQLSVKKVMNFNPRIPLGMRLYFLCFYIFYEEIILEN